MAERNERYYILTQGAQASWFGSAIHQARGISDHSLVAVPLRGPSRVLGLPPRLDGWSLRDREIFDAHLAQTEYKYAPEYFQYLRLGHALRKHIVEGEELPDVSPLQDRVLMEPIPEKGISVIYKKLMYNAPDVMGGVREAWSEDLGALDDEGWGEALKEPREIAIKARFRLIH
ncbi:hypothetical protein NDU88_003412 [Pleurodeles waltl]|uniref:Uncharacterized protein n=1 Tax=Pleurodeles waltl TaxID=8319 RepID=A0AAV7TNG1_PLEWA|nr:hypothetical protein NDU88_003412 [Pleurodeles waltl]